MCGRVIKRGSFIKTLFYLNDMCENGDKMYTEEENLLVARKVNGEVLLCTNGHDLRYEADCKIIKHNITKKDIEVGDLLYTRNGAILRAITKNENEEHSENYSLEFIIRKGVSDSFKPLPFLWKEDFYYSISGMQDIVKVKKLDGLVEKTDMWYKHLNKCGANLGRVTLLVEPEEVIEDENIISFYHINGYLNTERYDAEDYINVYGYNVEKIEAISLEAIEDFYIREGK